MDQTVDQIKRIHYKIKTHQENNSLTMSTFEEVAAHHDRLESLVLSIPDSLFSELAANRGITDASEYFRKAEEILLKKGLQDANEFFIPKKDKNDCEGYKEAGNMFHKSGNLHLSLVFYNKW
jgi:hypothetical protein